MWRPSSSEFHLPVADLMFETPVEGVIVVRGTGSNDRGAEMVKRGCKELLRVTVLMRRKASDSIL